jgi:uncharacterized membrane protein YjjB (DUF3815 family)
MLDTLAEITATIGPVVLAGMGMAVPFTPDWPKWLWFVLFALAGALVFIATWHELHSTNVAIETTKGEVRGFLLLPSNCKRR